MNSKPIISIIMTAYNSEKYIYDAVMSIVSQTFKDWELIIVNDGSDDSTLYLLSTIYDPRIKVLTKNHEGHSAAKAYAFPHTHGEYITFFDSDDIAHPKWLEFLFEACIRHKVQASVCRFSFYNGSPFEFFSLEDLHSQVYNEYRMAPIFRGNIRLTLWNKMFHRSLFEGFEFPIIDPCSDVATCWRLICKANKIAVIDEKLVLYRQRDDSMAADRKKYPADGEVKKFILYADMLDYIWDKFPKASSVYKEVANRIISELTSEGVYSLVPDDVRIRVERIAG